MIEVLSALAKPLMSVANVVWSHVRRMYRERQAGQMPIADSTDLLDRGLEETLTRLRGGKVDDTWWQNLLNRIGHRSVAPDFLRRPALRQWLGEEQVGRDFKTLARQRIIGTKTDDPDTRKRLCKAYSNVTGENERLAESPIEVVLAVVVAGFLETITSFEPLAGMIQAGIQETRASLGQLQNDVGTISRKFEALGTDQHVVRAHSETADAELSLLLKQRSLSFDRVRQEIVTLTKRVTDSDLSYTTSVVRSKVLYWAARLHAVRADTVPLAKSYLEHLQRENPDADTRIIDALTRETDGDVDRALVILRDINTPDGRATLFFVLCRKDGEGNALVWFDEQQKRDNAGFLTGIGWWQVAACLAKAERWEEAAERLAAVQELVDEWPDLAFLEGVVNAALLLPLECRRYALEMNLFHSEMRPIEGPDADRRRARAKACFEKAETLLLEIDQRGRAQAAQAWHLWLRLTDPTPEVVSRARQEVQEGMKEGQKAVDLIPFASTFRIEFDEAPLERYLTQRKRLGGLDNRELLAELFLAELKMNPRDRAEFLEREEARLGQVVARATITGKRIEALVQDGQTARARTVLEQQKSDFLDYDYERVRAMIDANEGGDPRVQLEDLYLKTGSLMDLKNLVAHLRSVRDYQALQPRLEELFRKERTIENAFRLVECFFRSTQTDDSVIVAFLEANQDIVDRSLDLASAKAWALSRIGRLKEAEAINNSLLEKRDSHTDLELEINISLQSGEWERFPVIVNRAWGRRSELEPGLLMRLASLAAEADTTAGRALDLANLALSKAPDDPDILISAYVLAVQLGREDPTTAGWMARAFELSSEDGPVWRVDLRKIVEEMVPAHRERAGEIERDLLSGNTPLHAAAQQLSQPMSRFLIDIPRKNAEQQDGRKLALVPIFSGARRILETKPEWSLGLDMTSLMALGHLGLLGITIRAFRQVVLSPDTMIFLLNEKRRARFHQPSLVREAEELRALMDQGLLKIEQALPKPPEWLVNEVGRDFAELMEAARKADGRVVRPYPIHKLKSFMESEAELGDYAKFVLSTKTLTQALFERGHIDARTYEGASEFLRERDRGTDVAVDPLLIDRALYLDDLALGFLQKAGILQAACNRGLALFVHPSAKSHQFAVIEANREGNRLAETLENIRVTLREALDTGQAIFMSRRDWNEETEIGWFYRIAPTMAQVVKDVRPCDAVCVEDRFFNRLANLRDEGGRIVPLVCLLDLLQHLEVHGHMTSIEKYRVLHKLRQAGYVFVPVDPDELEHYLLEAGFDQDGHLIESAEMRTLRQTLMRIRSLDMVVMPAEGSFLGRIQIGCIQTIRRLWGRDNLRNEHAVALSDWVWRNVAPSPLDWARIFQHESRRQDTSGGFTRHVALLLKPMHLEEERHQAFRSWVEEEVLAPLLPANVGLVDDLAALVRMETEHFCEEIARDESKTDSGISV